MKRKELYRLIANKAEADLPDVYQKINLSEIEVIPETASEKPKLFPLRSVFTASFSFLVLLIVGVFAIQLLSEDPIPSYTPLETDAELIGFQAISAASLLGDLEIVDLSQSFTLLSEELDEDPIETQLDTINRYLNMLEVTLGSQNEMTYLEKPSDREGYTNCICFESIDLLDNPIAFELHYNLVASEGKTLLTGLLINKDDEYAYSGEIYTENGEVRSRFTARINESNYVIVEDYSTATEQRFNYQLVQGGLLANQAMVRLESLGKDVKAQIEMNAENHNFTLMVEKTAANDGFRVRYQVSNQNQDATGDIDVTVEFDSENQNYQYRYIVRNQMNTEAKIFTGKRRPKNIPTTMPGPNTTTDVPTTTMPEAELPTTNPPQSGNQSTIEPSGTNPTTNPDHTNPTTNIPNTSDPATTNPDHTNPTTNPDSGAPDSESPGPGEGQSTGFSHTDWLTTYPSYLQL